MRSLDTTAVLVVLAGLALPCRASAQDQSHLSRASELTTLSLLGVLVLGEIIVDSAHLLLQPSGNYLRPEITRGEPRRVMAGVELVLGALEIAAGVVALAWWLEDPEPWGWSPAVAAPLFAAGLLHIVLGALELDRPDVSVGIAASATGASLQIGGAIDG